MLKKGLFFLYVSVLFTHNSFAQESSRWHLPEGANARLGKGAAVDIAYSPDGRHLAVVSRIGIWLYETASYREVALFPEDTAWRGFIKFSSTHADPQWTYGCGSQRVLQSRWHYTRKSESEQDGPFVGYPNRKTETRPQPSRWDSRNALQSKASRPRHGGDDRRVRLWNTETGRHIQNLNQHQPYATSATFSMRRLLNAEADRYTQTSNKHKAYATSAAFSPDGKTIATGSTHGVLSMWDAKTGGLKYALKDLGFLNGVLFSPDGTTLVCWSGEGTVHLCDTETEKHKHTLKHADFLWTVIFHPDGNTIATHSADKKVRLYDASTGTHGDPE